MSRLKAKGGIKEGSLPHLRPCIKAREGSPSSIQSSKSAFPSSIQAKHQFSVSRPAAAYQQQSDAAQQQQSIPYSGNRGGNHGPEFAARFAEVCPACQALSQQNSRADGSSFRPLVRVLRPKQCSAGCFTARNSVNSSIQQRIPFGIRSPISSLSSRICV